MKKIHHCHTRRARHSLFTRIAMAIIFTGLLVNFIVAVTLHHFTNISENSPVPKNITAYMTYLIKDLGTPPDMKRARSIAEERDLIIAFKSSQGIDATDKKIFPLIKRLSNKEAPILFHHGYFLFSSKRDRGTWYFAIHPSARTFPYTAKAAAIILISLSVIMLFLLMLVRWILKPIKELEKGVKAVSEGDFSYTVKIKGKDELSSLSRAYNIMRERIESMMTSKERLLIDMSHELRSPLTRMKVALEMMEPNSIRNEIADDAREMSSMIDSLLDNYRLGSNEEPLKLQEVNLGEILARIIAKENSPRVVMPISPHDCIVTGDRALLTRLFQNLISNALKHAPEGSITITLTKDEESSIVVITDQGPGIAPEHLEKIFEPFYRSDLSRTRETGGFGLGLSICRKITESHRGTITLTNREPHGLKAEVVLPFNS